MKRNLGFLLFGVSLGFTTQKLKDFYTPHKTIPSSKRELVNNYIVQHNLKPAYMIAMLKSLGLLWKGFYNYGLQYKLQGFNFNKMYVKRSDSQENLNHLYCIFSPTQYVCGHPQIQDGGATATIIDQSMGYLAVLFSQQLVATVKLDLDFKKPIIKDAYYVLELIVYERDGRKIFLNGKIRDIQTKQLTVDSEGLFYTVNWDHKMGRVMKKIFSYFYHHPQNAVPFSQGKEASH